MTDHVDATARQPGARPGGPIRWRDGEQHLFQTRECAFGEARDHLCQAALEWGKESPTLQDGAELERAAIAFARAARALMQAIERTGP